MSMGRLGAGRDYKARDIAIRARLKVLEQIMQEQIVAGMSREDASRHAYAMIADGSAKTRIAAEEKRLRSVMPHRGTA